MCMLIGRITHACIYMYMGALTKDKESRSSSKFGYNECTTVKLH